MRKRPDPQGQGQAQAQGHKATVLAESAWAITLFCVACGAVVGLLVPVLADWLVTLRWAPLKGPAKLLTSIPEPGLTIGAVVVGGLLGLLVGLIAVHESLTARISDSRVVLTIRDEDQEFPHDAIALAFRDGKQLVLLAPNSMEIAREHCGLPWRRLADAFTEHGYSWADEDPHRDEFRRWVPETPGLPDGANALLRARAQTLKKDDDAADARELRAELMRLGVVVRDENGRQYWRLPQQS
ncbi:YqeB family protein [Streptomyces sp. 2A115]|uniref:YqeB family protein n=1 Tax=Streptomyces sp. 2A115 TaxID=3457439 RepID=UPI003FD293CF